MNLCAGEVSLNCSKLSFASNAVEISQGCETLGAVPLFDACLILPSSIRIASMSRNSSVINRSCLQMSSAFLQFAIWIFVLSMKHHNRMYEK